MEGRLVLTNIYLGLGHSKNATETILASWRESTLQSYSTYIQLWIAFNSGVLNLTPEPHEVTDFLQCLFESGLGYSALNTARSALSTFIFNGNDTIGKNPEITRFMKGVMGKAPPLPKYNEVWDLDIVLDYIEQEMWPLKSLTFLQLLQRLAMLLALSTGNRGQSLHLMRTDCMVTQGKKYKFDITVPVKNYADAGDVHLQNITLEPFDQNKKICPVVTLQYYLWFTQRVRKTQIANLCNSCKNVRDLSGHISCSM